MENTKVCCRCGKTKQQNEMVSGRTQCKKCHAIWMVEWRKNNLELNRVIQKQNYQRRKAKQN